MEDFYTVVETQVTGNAISVVPPVVYDTEAEAKAAYFQICHAIAQSKCDYHSCYIIQSNGILDRDKWEYIEDRREEKSPFYVVLEIQQVDDVKAVLPVAVYTENPEAMSAYFYKLSFGVKADTEYSSAHIVRDDGIMTEGRVFDRRVPPAPPEPEQEPEVEEEA